MKAGGGGRAWCRVPGEKASVGDTAEGGRREQMQMLALEARHRL